MPELRIKISFSQNPNPSAGYLKMCEHL